MVFKQNRARGVPAHQVMGTCVEREMLAIEQTDYERDWVMSEPCVAMSSG